METLIQHALEPDIADAPPRHVSLSPRLAALSALALILFLLLLGGGTRVLWEAAKLGWIDLSGQNIFVRIVKIDTAPANSPENPPVQAMLHYASPSALGTETGTIPLSAPLASAQTPLTAITPRPTREPVSPEFHVGSTLILRRAHWFGHSLLIPWPPNPGGKIVFLALCGGLITAVGLTLTRRLWDWVYRRVHLLRHGIATVGTITHKHSQTEDTPRYFIRYGYGDQQTPPISFESEEQITFTQWKSLDIGQPITVLYDLKIPANSGLYILLRSV